MAAKTKTMQLTSMTLPELQKLLPSDIALAVYISNKTKGLQTLIDKLLIEMNKKSTGARTKHDIAKLLLDRVLGPVIKGGMNIDTHNDGTVNITWLDTD
jgi:hypothetical protein